MQGYGSYLRIIRAGSFAGPFQRMVRRKMRMKQKAEELKKAYENLNPEAKESIGKLEALIEKNAMTPDQVDMLIDHALKVAPDGRYPELDEIEKVSKTPAMTREEYAALYKKMAEEILVSPEKYSGHVRASGMSKEELADLFRQIEGAIDKYPEVWESREAASMLHPKNLAILVNVFKKDKGE